jgi:hypothetical protein
VTINSKAEAKAFFSKVFQQKELPIFSPEEPATELCRREMRAYLVKSESEFQNLAYKKYTNELQ